MYFVLLVLINILSIKSLGLKKLPVLSSPVLKLWIQRENSTKNSGKIFRKNTVKSELFISHNKPILDYALMRNVLMELFIHTRIHQGVLNVKKCIVPNVSSLCIQALVRKMKCSFSKEIWNFDSVPTANQWSRKPMGVTILLANVSSNSVIYVEVIGKGVTTDA
mgnify:FL=1